MRYSSRGARDTPLKVLVAEDDPTTRRLLDALLRQWGYEVMGCADGNSAWATLLVEDGPSLALVDWQMPGIDGTEVIRRSRESIKTRDIYFIMLTSKATTDDVVAGFGAGADDYLIKPFQPPELRARMRAGQRVLELQAALRNQVHQLEEALANIQQLQGLLPICSYCKKIRDDKGYWDGVESYVSAHTGAQFSHGICPDCYTKHVQPQIDALDRK